MSDTALLLAVEEMENGLIEASLGKYVVKKRVSLPGRGKRGGARTLVAYKRANKAFFVYAFAKNQRTNINDTELRVLKLLASQLLGYTNTKLVKAVKHWRINRGK
ncbi:MAG: type II toxin-antitoxin system RelE/ParE family toxin [Xanthomonadales bacterium]|nr:type II toxin-antitoxin system RelE/ParE family toxin [Xanthomonadales bacterium]